MEIKTNSKQYQHAIKIKEKYIKAYPMITLKDLIKQMRYNTDSEYIIKIARFEKWNSQRDDYNKERKSLVRAEINKTHGNIYDNISEKAKELMDDPKERSILQIKTDNRKTGAKALEIIRQIGINELYRIKQDIDDLKQFKGKLRENFTAGNFDLSLLLKKEYNEILHKEEMIMHSLGDLQKIISSTTKDIALVLGDTEISEEEKRIVNVEINFIKTEFQKEMLERE